MQLEFAEPFEAKSVAFIGTPVMETGAAGGQSGFSRVMITLEASDDGVQFNKVATINASGGFGGLAEAAFLTTDFPATKARYFRLTSAQPRQYGQLSITGANRIFNWQTKANFDGGFWRTTPVAEPANTQSKDEASKLSQYILKEPYELSQFAL